MGTLFLCDDDYIIIQYDMYILLSFNLMSLRSLSPTSKCLFKMSMNTFTNGGLGCFYRASAMLIPLFLFSSKKFILQPQRICPHIYIYIYIYIFATKMMANQVTSNGATAWVNGLAIPTRAHSWTCSGSRKGCWILASPQGNRFPIERHVAWAPCTSLDLGGWCKVFGFGTMSDNYCMWICSAWWPRDEA